MAILHRAIFTWFTLLVFLILLCLKLESRTHWNWFIVFIPMWIYDAILLIYVVFHMISHCKSALVRSRKIINHNIWCICAVGLKMAAQIIICVKMEYAKSNLPIHVVMIPIWLLLPILIVNVFTKLLKNDNNNELSRYFDLNMFSLPDLVTQVTEAALGSTAVLRCNSKDDFHNFMFWQLGQNQIIGPENDYDTSKYKYEVLSGKLFIKDITPNEAGYYRCISKNIDEGSLSIGAIQMLIKENNEKFHAITDSDFGVLKIIIIVISLLVLFICSILLFRLKQENKKIKASSFVYDEDDEGSGDEIYNRTTININDSKPGPSKPIQPMQPMKPMKPLEDHITGIDNRGLDADFNAAFEQIAIDVANRNFV